MQPQKPTTTPTQRAADRMRAARYWRSLTEPEREALAHELRAGDLSRLCRGFTRPGATFVDELRTQAGRVVAA